MVLVESCLVGRIQSFAQFDIEDFKAEMAGSLSLGESIGESNLIFS
jgi:hypothetical protein